MKRWLISFAVLIVFVFAGVAVSAEETGKISVMVRYTDSGILQIDNTTEDIGSDIEVVEMDISEISSYKNNQNVNYIEEDVKVKKATLGEDWYLDFDNVKDIYADTGIDGENVKVAILDTGISFCNGRLISGGVNILNNDESFSDNNGHGTSMANIIASIAPKAQYYSVKVLDNNGEGYYSDVIAGINWAIDNNMDVICMSFGAFDYSYFLEEAVDRAFNSGIAMVAAAGNDDSDKMYYPAAYNQVISVGACDENGNVLQFTNGKDKVDVFAPGSRIVVENHRAVKLSNKGTSVSSAQVAAVVALMKSVKPEYNIENLYTALSHSAQNSDTGIKILNGYSAISNMNAFISSENEYIPTLDKTYADTEDGKVAVSYKYDAYDNQTVRVNESVTVRAGFYSNHDYCDITVYKSTNTSNILTSVRRAPVSGNAYITYTCPEDVLSSPGTYYIRYHASGNGANTAYDDVFTVNVVAISADEYEPNNSFATACELEERNGSLYANIHSSSDKDYYKISLNKGETIDITLSNLERDYELFLYNPSKSEVKHSTKSGLVNENITYTATKTGYHYICVYGFNGAFCSEDYRLRYLVTFPADEYEEHKNGVGATLYNNDTYANYTSLSVTNNLTIYPMISSESDIDWFGFVAPKGDVVISLEDLPLDYELELYASETDRIGLSDKTGTQNETIRYTVEDDYKYLYIKVYGFRNNCSSSPYTLKIFCEYINDATVNPGKNTAAVSWTTGFRGTSVVNYGKTASVTSEKNNGNTWNKEHSINVTGLSTATKYFYKVSTIGQARSSSQVDYFYTLDRYENNDTMSTAYTISSAGQTFTGTLHSADDVDYFKVTLDVPGIVSGKLEDIPSGCDYDLLLCDADRNLMAISNLENNSDEYFECYVEPGRYYFIVYTDTRKVSGDSLYSFTYDFERIRYNDVWIVDELHLGGDGAYSPTGNYSKTFSDLEFTNSAYDYYVGRTYNSRDKIDSHFGRGWIFSFEGKVSDLERTFEYSNGNIGTRIDDNYKMVRLPDSSTYIFEKQSDGSFVAQDSRAKLVNNGNGYTFITQDKRKYIFNSAGYLIEMCDKYGNSMSITVNSSGKVQAFTDPTGNTFTVAYDNSGYISKITENVTGRNITYGYTNGLLTSVVNPSGITMSYEYDSDKYISNIKNNEGVTVETLTYVSGGNEAKKIGTVTDAYGNTMTYSYNETENKTVITDSNGRTNTQSYDDKKFITSIIDAAGRTKNIQYTVVDGKNKYGEIKSETDEVGNTTSYERDSNGNVTKQTNPDGSYADYSYDENNNLLWERDSLGNFTLYGYDEQGVKIIRKAKYLNKVAANETVELNSSNSNLFAIEEYSYYPNSTAAIKGLLYRYKNADGYITEYTYDSHGNPLSVKDPETGLTTNYTYNDINYTLSKTTPNGYVTRYEYDKSGNLVKEINVDDGGITRIVYDANGRKTFEVNPEQYDSTKDSLNIAENINAYSNNADGTKYEYFPNGLLKKVITPEGDVTEYTYDLYGNTATETIPCQFDETGVRKTEYGQYIYEYDTLNRLISVKYKETPTSEVISLKTISYSEEQNGNEFLSVKTDTTYYDTTNSSSVISKTKYNDKVVYVGYSDGTTESYSYYDDGELKSSTDGNGYTTHYKYNTFDSENNVTYNESWSPVDGGYAYVRTDYDFGGNLVAEYKSGEIVELNAVPQKFYKKTRTYYKNNKLKSEYDTEGRKTEYEYDNDGNLSRALTYTNSEHKNVIEYTNNSRGQIITETKVVSVGTIYNDARTSLVTLYSYDLNGNLITKTLPDGVIITNAYDKQNRIISTSQSLTDENDTVQTAIIEEKYNSNDDVYYRKDARGAETYYVYNNRGLCIKEVNPLGGTTLNYYDYAGRMINTVKPNAYSESGTLQTMNNTEYVYNNRDLVIKKIENYSENEGAERKRVIVSEASYDANGNMLAKKDALGNTTIYTYTPNNKIKTKLTPESAEDGLTYTLQYMYNGMGQVVSTTNANGVITSITYDALDNVLTKSISQGSETSVVETNTYDKAGNLLSKTDGNNNTVNYTYNSLDEIASITYPSDTSVPENFVERKYAPNGKIAYEVNSIGTETLYSYDEAGRNTSVTIKSSTSAPLTTGVKFDLSGNAVKDIDGNGNITVRGYDMLNRKTSETVNGKTTEYVYDLNGNNISVTDWRDNTSANVYDSLDRLVKVYDAYGKLISEKSYNANNLQISDKDALGNITQYEYDKDGRLIKTTDALNHSTSKAYDSVGNVVSQTTPNGNIKTFAYDMFNNLISVTQTVNDTQETTLYTFDACGNMLTQTDANGNTTMFEYNSANLVSKKIFSGGLNDENRQEIYTYYADGSVATKTDRNGVVISYAYDIAGRPTETVAGTKTVANGYDAAGNKLSVIDSTGTTSRSYDAEGRVLSKSQPGIGVFTYEYDVVSGVQDGEYAEISINPANKTVKKVFDKVGRLHYVYDENVLTATYNYYDNGALRSVVYGNGVSEEYTYYANGSLKTLINKNAAGVITDQYTYAYDLNGNQISKTETIASVQKGTTNYSYDDVDRLVGIVEPSGKTTNYSYDKAGNRTNEVIVENGVTVSTAYTYDNLNRLLKTETNLGETVVTYDYQYDFNGNVYSKTKSTQGSEAALEKVVGMTFAGETENGVSQYAEFYEYDEFNQLIKVMNGASANGYAYNGEGMRVLKTVGDTTTLYGYEYDKPVIESDGTNVTAINLYGTNLINRTADNSTMYYQFNGHADVVGLTDNDGILVASYYYDVFGVPTETSGDVSNPFRYGGYVYDEETGLYYIKSRFYDASIARFIQEDVYAGKYSDPLSLNLYTYVMNNPLKYLDPTGMIPDEIKVGGVSIGYLKSMGSGVYGSIADLMKAYKGTMKVKKGVYSFTFGKVSMNIDIKNKELNKGYKMNVKGDRWNYEYPYFVLVNDEKNKGCVKILVNVDSFVKTMKAINNSSAEYTKIYNSADSLAKDVSELEQLAKDYSPWDNNKNVNKLVLQQMRRHKYNGAMWSQVAGFINSDFTDYLKYKNKEYLSFYGDNVYMKDATTGGYVDIPHFAATLNALRINTIELAEFAASFMGGGGSEEQVDDLAGWAGDLQSLRIDLQPKLGDTYKNDYGKAYAAVNSILAQDGTNFDHNDMLADIDAVNINAHIKGNNGLLSANLKGYYNNTYDGTKVSTRYTSFLQNQFGTTDKETIRKYIGQYFFNDSTGFILNGVNTPLRDYKKPVHPVTDAEKSALRDGFLNYIYNVNSGR